MFKSSPRYKFFKTCLKLIQARVNKVFKLVLGEGYHLIRIFPDVLAEGVQYNAVPFHASVAWRSISSRLAPKVAENIVDARLARLLSVNPSIDKNLQDYQSSDTSFRYGYGKDSHITGR